MALVKFLIYALLGVIILTLVLSNRHSITVELFLLPPVSMPLYLPIVVAFGVGLFIGLGYAAKISLFRRTPK